MNLAYLSILLAAAMPILLAGAAKFGGKTQGVAYDNHAPRMSLQRLAGWPQRANWAQQNCWEAFPVFAAAVLMALQAGQDLGRVELWACAFIALRLAYALCYVLDWALLRSLCWLGGMGISLGLMIAAL